MIIGGTDWSAENHTPQQMARAALRLTSGNVLYLYRELQTNLPRAIAKRQWTELRSLRWKATHLAEGRLHVIPLGGLNAILPLAISPKTRNVRQWIFRREILRAMKEANIDPTSAIALVYWWHFPTLWSQLGIRKVIFDILDHHAALGMNIGRTRHNDFTSKLVSDTASYVDAVTIVSPALVDVLPQDCVTTLLPNGIDVALAESELKINPGGHSRIDIQRDVRTTVAFVGGTVGRVDWNLVADVASARPGWRFLFIGSAVPRGLPQNIVSTDCLPYGDVLRLLRSCHLGWIPFLDNALTRCGDFRKTWDYRLAGLRVVATKLPSTVSAAEIDHRVTAVFGQLQGWLSAMDTLVSRAKTEGSLPISGEAMASRSLDARLGKMLALVEGNST